MFIIVATIRNTQVGFFGPYTDWREAKKEARKIRIDFENTTDEFVVLTIKELVKEVADLD